MCVFAAPIINGRFSIPCATRNKVDTKDLVSAEYQSEFLPRIRCRDLYSEARKQWGINRIDVIRSKINHIGSVSHAFSTFIIHRRHNAAFSVWILGSGGNSRTQRHNRKLIFLIAQTISNISQLHSIARWHLIYYCILHTFIINTLYAKCANSTRLLVSNVCYIPHLLCTPNYFDGDLPVDWWRK